MQQTSTKGMQEQEWLVEEKWITIVWLKYDHRDE